MHEAKRCACGTKITARRLNQHGKCEHCRLTAGLADGNLDKLRHMLGATAHQPKMKWDFRNHYLCNGQDCDATERLVAVGLVRAGEQLLKRIPATPRETAAALLVWIVRASPARWELSCDRK